MSAQFDTSGHVRLRGQYANGQTHDVTFWPDLSPLTPYLGDDGKVYLREA